MLFDIFSGVSWSPGSGENTERNSKNRDTSRLENLKRGGQRHYEKHKF